MKASHEPICHESWFRLTSDLNILADICVGKLQDVLHLTLQQKLRNYAQPNECIFDLLIRASSSSTLLDNSEFKLIIDSVNNDLKAIVEWRQERFARAVGAIKEYLTSAMTVSNYRRRDRAWMLKAYEVVIRIQPVLEYSNVYVVRWRCPNVTEFVNEIELLI